MLAILTIVSSVFAIAKITMTVILYVLIVISMLTTAAFTPVIVYNIPRAGMQTSKAYGVLTHSGFVSGEHEMGTPVVLPGQCHRANTSLSVSDIVRYQRLLMISLSLLKMTDTTTSMSSLLSCG